jgi:hypothetical protein
MEPHVVIAQSVMGGMLPPLGAAPITLLVLATVGAIFATLTRKRSHSPSVTPKAQRGLRTAAALALPTLVLIAATADHIIGR